MSVPVAFDSEPVTQAPHANPAWTDTERYMRVVGQTEAGQLVEERRYSMGTFETHGELL